MEEEIKAYRYKCPSCFQCPCCFSIAVVVAVSSMECALQCGVCLWRSDQSCGIKGGVKSEIEILITEREHARQSQDAFKLILKSLQNKASSASHKYSQNTRQGKKVPQTLYIND
jgi:hypothetical protein